MRHRLPLLAAICLLPGAALPQAASLQSVLECKAGRQPALALLETLPIEDDLSGETGTVQRYYEPVPGQTVFGMAPTKLGLMITEQRGDEFTLISSIVPLPYDEVESAVLAANGVTQCERRTPPPANTCIALQRREGLLDVRIMVRDFGQFVMVGCGYSPARG